MISPRRPAHNRDDADTDDPDRAEPLPSIWDVVDDDPDEPHLEDDPFAPPIPMATRRPDWLDPAAWAAAEQGAGRALAMAAEAMGRLDERLRRTSEATRAAWRERLALQDISALLWAEGIRLRPETLALAGADRLGRTEDEDQVILRGLWAARRLAGQGRVPETARDIPRFLGRMPRRDEDPAGDAPWEALPEALIPTGPDARACEDWCRAMAGLSEAHPLTRSAVAFHLWRGLGLSGPEIWLEPGVVAARVAGLLARGGLVALPLIAAGSERALVRRGGGAGERLETWLDGLAQTAGQAHLMLDRIEAWQARAAEQAAGMKGKGAPALIALLAARPILSARDVTQSLGMSAVQVRTLLNRLHALGLIRELTGHSRFRFWTAAM